MNAKTIIVVLILLGAGLGLYIFMKRPKQCPDLPLITATGEKITLDKLLDGAKDRLITIVGPADPLSKYSADMINGLVPQYGNRLTLAVILFQGSASAVTSFQAQNQLAVPVYALEVARDPYSYNELINTVGESNQMHLGTVLLLDHDRKILFSASQGDVKKVPDMLAERKY